MTHLSLNRCCRSRIFLPHNRCSLDEKFLSKIRNSAFDIRYTYTKIKDGSCGGRPLTYFHFAADGCNAKCSTNRLDMKAIPSSPVTF
jgi:hypothetical protein